MKTERPFSSCVLQDGREYLWQCSNKEERDIWAMSVSASVRSLGATVQRQASVPQDSNATAVNLSDVLVAMQDPEAGLVLQHYHIHNKDYNNCFTGSSVIDWLLKWHFSESRDGACRLAEKLLYQAHILPLLPGRDKKSSEVTPSANKSFCDSSDACYRFTSVVQPSQQRFSMFMDSSSDSAGSSDAEYSEGDVLESTTKGEVVKEGFLMKKGYRLKRWKVQKVVVRNDPPTLSYYSASKNDVRLLKTLKLDGAFVVDMEEYHNPLTDGVSSKRSCVFCLSLPHGPHKRSLVSFQADDLYSKKSWLECLQSVCKNASLHVENVD